MRKLWPKYERLFSDSEIWIEKHPAKKWDFGLVKFEIRKSGQKKSCRWKKNTRFEKKKHAKMLKDEGDTALGSSAIFR